MKKEAVILGYSGHAFVVLDILLANNYFIKGYCEKNLKSLNPYNLNYLGSETNEEVMNIIGNHDIFVGIGDNSIRKRIISDLLERKCMLPCLIHPSVTLSTTALIDSASVILPGVVINSLVRIGKGTICNTSSVIEHECVIGNYVHIAPGAVLAGKVSIGNNSFIGANAVIKQGIHIGENVIIGAGSVVTKNVDSGKVVMGNPAQSRQN